MGEVSAYQRRKREIKYLEQCIEELEETCKSLAVQLKENKIQPLFYLSGAGLDGDESITPYNNGEFNMELS